MLVQTKLTSTPAVARLTQAWATLYTVDFTALPLSNQPALYLELIEANTTQGRALTGAKLKENLIRLQSELASIQTSSLYAYMSNVMHLNEVRQVAETAFQVYSLLVRLYQQDAIGFEWIPNPFQTAIQPSSSPKQESFETFARTLEPVLLQFQRQQQQTQDWRSIGFLTTQFNFCSQLLIHRLTPCERLLFDPYLRFVEEQVAHPWQRVCAAAENYETNGIIITMIEKMILLSPTIAQNAFQQILQQCQHTSRRGALSNPDIMHSCIRDFKMFQAYLWLCILEGNLEAVENELLDLCIRVLPSIGVKWELIQIWTQTLTNQLLHHLDVMERQIVWPYAIAIHQTFLNAKQKFDMPLAQSIV